MGREMLLNAQHVPGPALLSHTHIQHNTQLPQLMKAAAENMWNNGNETESRELAVYSVCSKLLRFVSRCQYGLGLKLVIIIKVWLGSRSVSPSQCVNLNWLNFTLPN